mmetsp:Transcript_74410/g.215666  ORF Transcript_74410/g.215666 Transcript_74410/m.215666 type:complete len:255 (+) Transcript_74410:1415-2179(+)
MPVSCNSSPGRTESTWSPVRMTSLDLGILPGSTVLGLSWMVMRWWFRYSVLTRSTLQGPLDWHSTHDPGLSSLSASTSKGAVRKLHFAQRSNKRFTSLKTLVRFVTTPVTLTSRSKCLVLSSRIGSRTGKEWMAARSSVSSVSTRLLYVPNFRAASASSVSFKIGRIRAGCSAIHMTSCALHCCKWPKLTSKCRWSSSAILRSMSGYLGSVCPSSLNFSKNCWKLNLIFRSSLASMPKPLLSVSSSFSCARSYS